MVMDLRRFAVDAGVVAVLATATAAYVRQSDGWTFFSPDAGGILKLGGDSVWQAELTRWWAATSVGMAAMLLRSRLPIAALAGAVAMTLIHVTSTVMPLLPLDVAAAVALFTLAAGSAPRWISYAACAITVALAFAPVLWVDQMDAVGPGGAALAPSALVALAWLFGDRSRARSEESARRARELERERDQQAAIATAAERARIARELHDAVAHGLSIIVIQAQAAAGALDRRPDTARAALDAIEATGRDSLTEMRHLLGQDRPEEAELAPLPGPADLPALIERVRAAGLAVRASVTGEIATLPTGIGLSIYRIVQESLTNVLKHAGPLAGVDVDVHRGPDFVELTVADTGRGVGGPLDERRGSGLRGMRERVALLGGTLTAGDRPGGGFQIHARLPLAVT
jgi:signal transduction histidine kinase